MKLQRLLSTLLLSTLLPIAVWTQDITPYEYPDGNFRYTISGIELNGRYKLNATVKSYRSIDILLKDLLIPSSVTITGDYVGAGISATVIAIGDNAFKGVNNAPGFFIPNTIKTIGASAFQNCTRMSSITIPSSVTSIGDQAFDGCKALKTVTVNWTEPLAIASGTDPFPNRAFIKLNVPDGTEALYKAASYWQDFEFRTTISNVEATWNFSDGLTYGDPVSAPTFTITSGSPAYLLREGSSCWQKKNGSSWVDVGFGDTFSYGTYRFKAQLRIDGDAGSTHVLQAPVKIKVNDVSWEVDNTSINVYDNYSYVWAYSPEMTIVDPGAVPIAFADDAVKAICVAAWDTNGDGELSLTEAAAVTSLGNHFCQNTEIGYFNELEYFTGLTAINAYAFLSCTNLYSITLPSSITTIGNVAFKDCERLYSIQIPTSVTSIGNEAFRNCSGLYDIDIPDGVTEISPYLLDGCANLLSVYFRGVVTDYGDQAFANCPNLKAIYIMNNCIEPGAIHDDPFPSRANTGVTLHVPAHAEAVYRGTDYWKDFYKIEENPVKWLYYTDENGIKYQYDPGYEARLYSYNLTDATEFYVPSRITIDGVTHPVTAICNLAVASSTLVSLYVPSSVTYMTGFPVFYVSSQLTEITFESATPADVDADRFQEYILQLDNEEIRWEMEHPDEPFVSPFNNITLYVPAGSAAAYEAHDVWGRFTIEEYTPDGIAINEENFPDPNFRAYVAVDAIDLDRDGYLSDDEIAAVTTMNISRKTISSLTGIEYFTALTTLDCSLNRLSTLNVSANPELTFINCAQNSLTEINLSHSTVLETLACQANQLTELDVTACTPLKELYCYMNYLPELDLSNNTELQKLYCFDNRLTTLDVSSNTDLETLSCFKNQLTALDVTNNTALTGVYCYSNNISGDAMLDLVISLPTLSEPGEFCVINPNDEDEGNVITKPQAAIAIRKNWYVTTSPLGDDYFPCIAIDEENFPDPKFRAYVASTAIDTDRDGCLSVLETVEVTEMDVSGKGITTMKGIEHFTELNILHCHRNKLTALDLSANTKLNEVYIHRNQIGEEAMTAFVESLPISSGMLCVLENVLGEYASIITEGNVWTTEHTTAARSKHWTLITWLYNPLRGNVNEDQQVTIADVTALVNIILGKNTACYDPVIADVNGDNVITIADVTTLINLILGK